MASILGFPFTRDEASIGIRTFAVPGRPQDVNGTRLRVRADMAPLLIGLAAEFARLIEPLHPEQCGGYNFRPIAASGNPSRHGAGIAIDLNYDVHKYGTRTFSPEKADVARALARKYGLRWGGDYTRSTLDEMHFEVNLPIAEALRLAASDPGRVGYNPGLAAGVPRDNSLLTLQLAGKTSTQELVAALTDSSLERTLEGASSLRLMLRDESRGVLRGIAAKLGGSRILVDGVGYELAGVKKDGNQLTLEFEDQVAATLRRQTGLFISEELTVTRTEFARLLMEENADTRWIKFEGQTTQTYALQNGTTAQVEALEQKALSRGTEDDPDTETTWDCLGRIATEVGWRRWSDGKTLFFGSDQWLRGRNGLITVSEFQASGVPTPGVNSIDFSVDIGQEVSEVTIDCNFTRTSFPTGWGVNLTGSGPADGDYVVKTTARTIWSPRGLVTLQRPIAEIVGGLDEFDLDDSVAPGSVDIDIGNVGKDALKPTQVAKLAHSVGFRQEDLVLAVAICYAESSGIPGRIGGPNKKDGTYDRGLWQINDIHKQDHFRLVKDVSFNARVAYVLYKRKGYRFTDWAAFNNGSYRKWIDTARAAVTELGYQTDAGL